MKTQNYFYLVLGKFKLFIFVCLTLVAGCADFGPFEAAQNSNDFSDFGDRQLITPSELWIVPKTASFALTGQLEGDDYQLIGLENPSNMQGDNFLLVIAKGSKSQKRLIFDPAKPIEKLKLNTAPFYDLGASQLRQQSIGGGKVFWKEKGTGGKVNCVLGFRRITEEQATLPRNVFALEMILRNCVQGSYASALNPILDRGVNVNINGLSANKSTTPLWISPLAGPKKF